MQDIKLAVQLLKIANCPNCDGSGAVSVESWDWGHGCCGDILANGECCGNAIPIQVDSQEIEQCQWCAEREELLSKYYEELEV